jgi:hypothetical protein
MLSTQFQNGSPQFWKRPLIPEKPIKHATSRLDKPFPLCTLHINGPNRPHSCIKRLVWKAEWRSGAANGNRFGGPFWAFPVHIIGADFWHLFYPIFGWLTGPISSHYGSNLIVHLNNYFRSLDWTNWQERTLSAKSDSVPTLRTAATRKSQILPSTPVPRKMAPSAYRQKTRLSSNCFHTPN